MEKGRSGRLSKLRCIIKRWNSSGRIAGSASAEAEGLCAVGGRGGGGRSSSSSRSHDEEAGLRSSASFHGDKVPPGLCPVYVGKSRRRYLVGSGLVDHPLFRVLVERCGGEEGDGATVVGCEVVLFEHLLWMLENADPQPESLDELAEFYAC